MGGARRPVDQPRRRGGRQRLAQRRASRSGPASPARASALATLLYALIQGPVTSWTSGTILGAFAAAVVLLAAFIWWELRVPEPMLDLSFFEDRRFSLGCISIFGAFLCGGAVGIALLNSLLTSRFRSGIAAAVGHLPASARDAAGHGVSSALEVARRLPGRAGAALADVARHAFASGMLRAFTAGAVLSFLAAVVVFRYLAKGLRPRDDDPDAAAPSDEEARVPQEAVSRA